MGKKQLEPFQTGLGPLTDRWVNRFLVGENGEEAIIVDKVINPMTGMVREYVMPYVYAGLVMYLIIVLLLVAVLYTLYRQRRAPTTIIYYTGRGRGPPATRSSC